MLFQPIRANPGTAEAMATYVYVPDTDEGAGDSGNYTSYAGPACVYGRGHCVSWGGNTANVYVSVGNCTCAALREHRVTVVRWPLIRVPSRPAASHLS